MIISQFEIGVIRYYGFYCYHLSDARCVHHKEIELTFDEKIEEYFQTIAPSANEAEGAKWKIMLAI